MTMSSDPRTTRHYMTARKVAENLGASGNGTEHHWHVIVGSVLLIPLTLAFIFTFGIVLGGTHEEVLAAIQNPFVAILFALMLLVGLVHFRQGAQVVLEDYAHGTPRRVMIVAMIGVTYAILAVGLFAIARIAL